MTAYMINAVKNDHEFYVCGKYHSVEETKEMLKINRDMIIGALKGDVIKGEHKKVLETYINAINEVLDD